MARRNDHTRDELKELILDSAWRLVEARGAEGVTARAIAKDIGYTPGTIYNLYASMGDIYLHMNARTLDLLAETLATNSTDESPKSAIKAMALRYMQFTQTHRAKWQLLFNLQVTDGRDDADWYHAKVEQIFEPLQNAVAACLPHLERDKLRASARMLWASVHGLCVLQGVDKLSLLVEQKAADSMIHEVVDVFIAGLQNGKSR
ncbi:MAG: TetR/AcrR family transcriptional regulator [Alphaproteobacteria bacterium]|nr:TetR/AcrR family transcriptional regulator [Alphaproteobacteria bacterium]